MQFLFCLRNNGLTWREKQRVVINRRVNQRDAACTASIYYQYLALSIFFSNAKIRFPRRCLLLLASVWFQPTLNYSSNHARHWSHKSMCIETFPFSIFGSNAKIRSSSRWMKWIQLFTEWQMQCVHPWKPSKKWEGCQGLWDKLAGIDESPESKIEKRERNFKILFLSFERRKWNL